MLEIVMHFKKDIVNKMEISTYLKNKKDFTCFVIDGALTLQSTPKRP
jgi:hypothetical protein